jgi:hypothetical protein
VERETRGRQGEEPPPPADSGDDRGIEQDIDRELLDWWMLVMQGFHATHDSLASELTDRFNLGPGAAEVLVRLLNAPKYRMPMTRLAHETRKSSQDDRRLIYLELTDQGKDMARAISQLVTQIMRARVLTPLGRDGFAELADAMRELRDANDDLGK